MELLKITGIPLAEDFSLEDMPHTLTYALIYRSRVNSFEELPKAKRPPRNLWDKPHRLSEFLEEIFKVNDNNDSKTYMDFDAEDMD